MRDRDTLTKSLHTVTAVARLARYLQRQPNASRLTDTEACRHALDILGQPFGWSKEDETFSNCVAKCKALRVTS